MIRRDDVYKVGVLGRPHGIHGAIVLRWSDDVLASDDCDCLFVETDGLLVPFFPEEYSTRGGGTAIVKLCGVDTQERAKELTNCDVYRPRTDNDGAHEPTAEQIVGFTVVDCDRHVAVGTLLHVDDATENLLFVVRLDGTDEERLLPAGGDLVQDIDIDERRILMHLPDGILDI